MSRAEALAAALEEADPTSLAAGERLRRRFAPDDVAWALTQVALRRRAVGKLDRAAEMLFTPHGLEQATRSAVARWRAERLAAMGAKRVWDVGCGIGSDAMAFAEAGLEVVAVDADPETVEVATHNLALVGAGPARVGLAEELDIPAGDAVFLDPARRTARGRTWDVADFTPPWQLVLDRLAEDRPVCVKLGPGVPKEILPRDAGWCWVSDGGDVVEATLWSPGSGVEAVRITDGAPSVLEATGARLDVRLLGRFLAEPDGAAIRAGLVAEAAAGVEAWLLDEHVAYLSADQPIPGEWVTNFQVLEVLPYDRKAMQRWVREHGVGTLEIKKRALDVDPAQLRKQLKPKGKASATIILARTVEGAKAIVARRV